MDDIEKKLSIDKPCIEINIKVNNKPLVSSSVTTEDMSLKAICMAITELEKIKLEFLDKYSPDIDITSDDL